MSRPVPTERGRFITIEGPEGAGKTTQAGRLEAHLATRGIEAIRTREPGGTPLGERIRALVLAPSTAVIDPLADALLFNAARRQLVVDVIEPALAAGVTVVCARFADSTTAYQGFGGRLRLSDLEQLEAIATEGLKPDLTLLLDLPAEVGLERKSAEDHTRFEVAFDLDFHRRVRNGFLAIAQREPARIVVIDATRTADEVAAAVAEAADRLWRPVTSGGEPNRAVARIHP